jgi:enoyl-CoA hydratase
VLCVTEPNQFVLVDHPRPGVALVTLNRPERMNSMAFDVMVPLKRTLEALRYDNFVRVVVLTGAGRGFSSGADHKSAGSVPHVDGLTRPTFALRSMEVLDEVILGLRRLHQPVIAAVNGAAIGGGLCLALACDIRVAAESAYFRAAGINNGLTASELGLSYLLPRAIGASRAFEIMLTGRDVDAEEAARIGLVSRSVPGDELLETCYTMAEGIAAFSRPGIELTKRTLWSGLDAASLEGHMQAEGLGQLFVRLLTANFEEAVAARVEGRPPVFTDERLREESTSTDERLREESTSTDDK